MLLKINPPLSEKNLVKIWRWSYFFENFPESDQKGLIFFRALRAQKNVKIYKSPLKTSQNRFFSRACGAIWPKIPLETVNI